MLETNSQNNIEAELRAARARVAELERQLAGLAPAEAPQVDGRLAEVAAIMPVACGTFRLAPGRAPYVHFANQAFTEVTGLDAAQLAASLQPMFDRIDPQEMPRVQAAISISAASLQPWHQEFAYLHPIKGRVWLENHYAPMRSPDGGISWYGVTLDVSARHAAEIALHDSENWLSLTQHVAQIGTWEWDGATRKSHWSPQMETIYGRPLGKDGVIDWPQLIHPDDLAESLTVNEHAMRTGQRHLSANYRIIRPDGEIRWIQNYGEIEYSADGRPVRGFGVCIDTTQLKQTEELLHRYELLANHTREIILFVRQSDGLILEANAAAQQAYGYTRDELLALSIHALRAPDPATVASQMSQAARGGILFETLHRRRDGSIFPVEVSSQGALIDGVRTLVSVIRDISERRQAHARLVESEELFSTVFHTSPLLMALTDATNGRYLDVNEALLRVMGYPREEVIGRSAAEIGIFADLAQRDEALRILASTGHLQNFEADVLTRSGELRRGLFYGEYLELPGRRVLLTIMNDITLRKQAEQRLAESEQRYRVLFEGAREGIMVFNMTRRAVQYANPALQSMFGYSLAELAALQQADLFATPADHARMAEQSARFAAEGQSQLEEACCRRKDGSLFYADIRSSYTQLNGDNLVVGFFTDVTRRRRSEALLRARLWLSNIPADASLDDLLQETLDQAEHITDSQIGFFHFVEEDQVNLWLQNWSTNTIKNMCTAEGKGQHYPADQAGNWAICLRERRPVICNDYPNSTGRKGMPPGHAEVTRFISVPVLRDGKVVAIIGVGNKAMDYDEQDVELVSLLATETWDLVLRLRAEAAQRESEELYHSLAESQEATVIILDRHGTYRYINRAGAAVLQRSPAEMIGRRLHDFFPLPEVEARLKTVRRVILSEKGEVEEAASIFDGKLRWHRTSVQPAHGADGKVSLVVVSAVDITELKEVGLVLEQKVRARTAEIEAVRQRLELATRAAGIGIWDWDIKNDRLEWDEALYRLFGLPTGSKIVNANSWQQYIHPDDLPAQQSLLEAALRREKEFDSEYRIVWPDGSLHYIKANAILMTDKYNRPQRMIGVNYDITASKQAENMLRRSEEISRQANLELERAMRMKDEFLASMSHELRTPLTGILGLSEALQMGTYGTLEEKQVNALSNIESSGQHLLALINDILDVSKIEAGRLDLQPELCALDTLCQNSLQMVRGMAHHKNLQLQYSIQPQNLVCSADPRRLKQVLVNLLSNAVKFTPEGGRVGLEVTGDAPGGWVRLAVWDEGIGISPEDQGRLFQPFVQLDSRLAREQAGTGLGLALVKRLCELHGGSVQLESAPGQGSRFTVALPWNPQEQALPAEDGAAQPLFTAALPARQAASPLVLLVDDNEINRIVMADYLEAMNFRVAQVTNGLEYLDQLDQLRPDLVLMDIQMPGVDGLEAIRRTRAMPDPALAGLPIIAVTALAMPGDKERCLAAGARAYLSKPINLSDLLTIIRQTLGSAEEA